ncbi:MAG: glycosyltransferase family 39 protein [Lachnospiraceae bacterium]|nr:glycosyltransferase family 39 protein [Lachnospiraceae bacterium]
MKNKSAIAIRIAVVVGLFLIFLNAFLWNSKKEDYFLDEKYTFYFANEYVLSFGEFFSEIKACDFQIDLLIQRLTERLMDKYKMMSLDEVNAMVDAQKGHKFSYCTTLLFTVEDSHPPLYYLTFNTVNSSIPGISVKNTGFLINIVALLFTCYFVFKIAEFFHGKLCGLMAMLFYGLSFEFINNVTYFRMYAMLTCFVTLLLYLHLRWLKADFTYDEKKYLRAICVAEFFAMFTQFFAAIYIVPIFVVTLVLLRVNGKQIKKYVVSNVVTAVLYLVIWPVSIYQIMADESGADVRNTVSLFNIPSRVAKYVRMAVDSLFAGSKKYFFAVAVVIAVGLLWILIKLIKDKKVGEFLHGEKLNYYVYLIVPTAVFYVVTADIAPWTVDRYMMPIIAIVSALIVVFLWGSLKTFCRKEWICACIFIVLLGWSFYRVQGMSPYYLYTMTEEKQAYIDATEDKAAVIVEPDDQLEFADVLLTVNHPYWSLITVSGLNDCLTSGINKSDSYVFYINKYCNEDEIKETIEKEGLTISKLDYEKEFYYVYVYEAKN